jgi:hypothetical protein
VCASRIAPARTTMATAETRLIERCHMRTV